MTDLLIVLAGMAAIAGLWVWAFRDELGDRWNAWRDDCRFRRRHRRGTE